MIQPGFFDWQNRFEKIDMIGDPLLKINTAVHWELFRTEISKLRDKPRRGNAGAKPYDAVMMFKVLILQPLYNLADEAVEYQILDRMSLIRFWGCMQEIRCLMLKQSGCFVSS